MPGYEVIGKLEKKYVNQIFTKSNGVLFSQGFNKLRKNIFRVKKFETKFKSFIRANYAHSASSGTAALRIALASLGVGKDDEVITQCFTFVATVESIVESGATPVCTEINDTLNMCPIDLEKKITKKTKAVIVVHMLGVPADVQKIKKICKKKNLYLIEDTAWGLGAKIKNKFLGTIGDIGTFSFDFAKSLTTGEGGMVVYNKKSHFKKGLAWHDHGHENNPKFPRYKDTRKSSGFNFRMSELQAAVGLAQLKKFDDIFKKHNENKKKIIKLLKKIKYMGFRKHPQNSTDASESLIINFKNKKIAETVAKKLQKESINTKILPEALTWHFAKYWSHIESLKKRQKLEFDKSYQILKKSLSLPIFYKMKNNLPAKIFEIISKSKL
ncbi:aminotransferase class V-fold PLP-dependent enzyme [Candidatus Pelagibacter sp.]|nr:aminotransferase class V-fold PLP-dependent enzyme [Candidatus Pelagibacter sp.]